ncbi:MAG TPA: ABC transporter ATP-binding protein [Candidatus Bathyarchaeota archaeon]|nr:ABC transporter ATP-binding protein [Candidatus Bathyarchaeota archaeon]
MVQHIWPVDGNRLNHTPHTSFDTALPTCEEGGRKGVRMILVENLRVEVGEFSIRDVTMRVGKGEYMIVMGPSGAGKTVLLQTILGIYPPTSGRILVDGRDVTSLPPEDREFAYVPQNYALFPHMTVFENIAFGLRMRGGRGQDLRRRVRRIAEELRVERLLDRKPPTLSSGEKQRVAIARALVTQPQAILLDEPTASLDPELRFRARRLLRKLHHQLKFTAIHVTHDIVEAVMLGDKALFLYKGQALRTGSVEEILRTPEVLKHSEDLNVLKVEAEDREITLFGMKVGDRKPGKYIVVFRPEDVIIGEGNEVEGAVVDKESRGPLELLYIQVGEDLIKGYITRGRAELYGVEVGEKVGIRLLLNRIRIYEDIGDSF